MGASVRSCHWKGVVDVVTAYQTVGVFADPDGVDLDRLGERLAAWTCPSSAQSGAG